VEAGLAYVSRSGVMASVAPNELAGVRRESVTRELLHAARPRQWTKNLLLFAGLIFAAELRDPTRWLEATVAFCAYCAASSAAYLVNDVVDAPQDRRHPVKCTRPIARGDVSPRSALAVAAGLNVLAFAAMAAIGVRSLALIILFCALQCSYTLSLKRVALIDVMAIAGTFVVRATAGAEAVSVRISPWLFLCTGLLALLLALGKRRAELVLVGEESWSRPVLAEYTLELVDQLVGVVASATVISYSLYTFTARDSKAMMVTIPFVLFGIFRYLLLIHRRGLGEEPENMLLADRPIQVNVAVWAAIAAIILAVGA
jgi:4-hydroxybenzoate polyprenyltransferase